MKMSKNLEKPSRLTAITTFYGREFPAIGRQPISVPQRDSDDDTCPKAVATYH